MDLTALRGIGDKKSKDFKRLGISSVSDLYNYYPREYEDRSKLKNIVDIADNNKHFFIWRISSRLYQKNFGKMTISYVYVYEEKSEFGKIRLIWFNDRFTPRRLVRGREYKFYTSVSKKNAFYEAGNPLFCDIDDDEIGSIVSIYPLTRGISNKQIRQFMGQALAYFDKREEILSDNILEEFSLNKRCENLREIHFPTSIANLTEAKSQIKLVDLLKDLCFLDFLKKMTKFSQDTHLSYKIDNILSELSFTLTRSQRKVLEEILDDCNSPYTANRLLVGDVGSGKTIVAIVVMIIFALNGYQSAMMVPTELLAIQQFEKNIELFDKFNVKAALLTGSSKDKEEIKKAIKNGEIDILIGTHALIVEDVEFYNLKFVVNDEQHRFGVSQRQMLALKGEVVNYLTMTATPIPRTLSLKISEIIDLSIINELPKGRKPIETKLLGSDKIEILYENIERTIKENRQIYVVTNNIDSDDKNSLENLYGIYKKRFPQFKISILHGKMKAKDKEDILGDFNDGKIDILLATTVIEVGIDVANANTMIIYNANNFGLSTLHQLRGRVGRGEYESYCYLISDNPSPSNKLNILVESNDGFEIAKKDYEKRGGGKILSYLQHGKNLSTVDFLNMSKDEIEKCFKIYERLKDGNYQGIDLTYVEEYFRENKRIILN
ncbi:ATP-dependent DNA helicase RecG [Anaerococcus marasmi]|uniref:ATP-dependent DNA helicase RecG n=1 Tax=Anaerococcus marasmi TaxID=2057797 RepID=UPI000CF9AFEF|nr:ATP-dependent DNA helicase RecG [Anaerococcus marasmi]